MEALTNDLVESSTEAPTVQRAAEAMKVPVPKVVVQYENKDITANITPTLIEVNYTDFMEGESDSVELVLEDVERRWQNAWYPQHGDQVSVQIGYEDSPLLPCGEFEIDEVELDGPPDVVRIKALAAGVKRSVRTRNGRAYEDTTLADIAATIARRNKMQLTGKIEQIRISRATQVYETDLTFLKRVSEEYGYSFSVRGSKLCFFKRADLKEAKPTMLIDRTQVSSYRFRDKVHGVVASATVSYHDPHAKRSDPHRPLFGSNLHLYIDYPVNSARPHIVREAVNALREWEPRIEVVKVTVSLVDVATLACVVEWKFAAGVAEESFVTNLALGVAK